MSEIKQLFGVNTEDINYIYLADGEWYDIKGLTFEIIGIINHKPATFSAWCIRISDNKSLKVVGNLNQILLAEAEYS